MMRGEQRKRQAGFSLLEVLVAFVILTTALAVLFRIFSSGLHNLTVSGGYSQAVVLAESKLAEIGVEIPVQSGETFGEWEESGYRWRLLVEPYIPWEEDKPLTKPLRGYQLTLEVSWGEPGRERRLSLSALRLVAEGQI